MGGGSQQRRRGMPDTIRINGSCAHPWRRGVLTAIVGSIFPLRASAEQKPVLALHELVASAQDSIDRHEIAVLVVVLGLVLFAVVTAIMLVRARVRWTRLEAGGGARRGPGARPPPPRHAPGPARRPRPAHRVFFSGGGVVVGWAGG